MKYERGASEVLSQWADLYYIDWVDNNISYLFDIYRGVNPEHPNGNTYHKPVFVVRAFDWDIWCGFGRNQELIDFVDKWICIAPHMEKKLRSEANYGDKLKLIRPGVNLDKFTIKEKITDGYQLGMVLGDMWWPKNHMAGLDIFKTLYDHNYKWRLHIRGQQPTDLGEYWPVMFNHYLESRGIKDVVTLYDYQHDMNDWLENIDILLHPGMKETFCYAVGESLAKGIPVVVNEFYGSRDIWNPDYLYQTHEEAIKKVNDAQVMSPCRSCLRTYIADNHNMERMLYELDQYLEL